jgi:Na+-transporting NADH:ubiquinone oxidoreductase subunit NqrE
MASLIVQILSNVLEVIRNPHELLSTLDVLVVCVLATCIGFGRVLMIDHPREGFAVAWISSIGTILFWILAVLILRRTGLI